MSRFDIILSILGIKGIIIDPAKPDEIIDEYKGEKCILQHVIQRTNCCKMPMLSLERDPVWL